MTLERFSTTRLRAERLARDHWADLRLMDGDPVMMGHLGGPRDEAGTQAYLERNLAHWANYGFGLWILRDAVSDVIAGRACVRHLLVEGRDEVEIGYGFLPAFWGRGLATEVARKCVAIGFDELQVTSLVALTTPQNQGSQHVLEKVGMTSEGIVDHDGMRFLLYRLYRNVASR
ncbi:MAG TPA: GNAT family N-acetyltransferase [Gemmatimonadales bacterium]|jgi:RimJ/RimL family protein N-acetyltransferase